MDEKSEFKMRMSMNVNVYQRFTLNNLNTGAFTLCEYKILPTQLQRSHHIHLLHCNILDMPDPRSLNVTSHYNAQHET
jgi:hypothetical protein